MNYKDAQGYFGEYYIPPLTLTHLAIFWDVGKMGNIVNYISSRGGEAPNKLDKRLSKINLNIHPAWNSAGIILQNIT